MQLTDEEREHIRLSEEYRAEVRAKLAGPPREKPWYAEFTMPMIMLAATALVSGLLVPFILGKVDDQRREFELQSKLIEQIVGDDAAAQMALYQYRGSAADFKMTKLNAELEKRFNTLRSLDAEERQARRAELQQKVLRAHDLYDEAYAAMSSSMTKYFIEQRGNIEWVRLHYGDKEPLRNYVRASRLETSEAVRNLRPYHEELNRIYNHAAAQLRTCTDEKACQQFFDDIDIAVQRLRNNEPNFKAWEDAKRQLVHFISTNDPRI